jgi:hypothetical protein
MTFRPVMVQHEATGAGPARPADRRPDRPRPYALGTFSLEPDQALAIAHRPPACRFWNLVVRNAFMATESLDDDRTSINHGRAVPNEDGTVTVVVAPSLLGHPNAVSTAGRTDVALAFRWFLADTLPARPTVDIVALADAPTGGGIAGR